MQIFRNSYPIHGGDRKTFEVMISIEPLRTTGSVSPFLRNSWAVYSNFVLLTRKHGYVDTTMVDYIKLLYIQ